MSDSTEIDQGLIQDLDKEQVKNVIEDSILESALTQATDAVAAMTDKEVALPSESREELETAIREEIMTTPEFSSSMDKLAEDILNHQDITVGESMDELLFKAGDLVEKFVADRSSEIFNLAVMTASKVLSKEEVRNFLSGRIDELMVQLGERWLTGKEPTAINGLEYLSYFLVPILGKDAWLQTMGSLITTLATASPVFNAGFNLLGGILGAANAAGYLTSHGGPFSEQLVDLNGTKYLSTSVNGITLMLDVNPSITRPPLVVTTSKLIPSSVKAVISKIPTSLGGVAKLIFSIANNVTSKQEAIEVATSRNDWVARNADLAVKDLISSLYDYFRNAVRKSENSNPPVLQVPVDVPMESQLAGDFAPPGVSVVDEAIVGRTPGSLYAYNITRRR